MAYDVVIEVRCLEELCFEEIVAVAQLVFNAGLTFKVDRENIRSELTGIHKDGTEHVGSNTAAER